MEFQKIKMEKTFRTMTNINLGEKSTTLEN